MRSGALYFVETANMQDLGLSAAVALSPMAHPPASKYDRLIQKAKEVPAATTVVVHPCDETSLRGATEAAEAGIIVPIFVGPEAKIKATAREHSLDISRYAIVPVRHSDE